MHKITFFPLGNADCLVVDCSNGQKMLFDYGNEDDRCINLETAIRSDLEDKERDYFDVVAFTHLDKDHICKATELFYFEHAVKYQSENRIKIKTLWVPAAAIIEESLTGEARIIRAEARHRLRQGKGIRVFSRPGKLEDWLKSEGLSLESRKHLITDAGQLVPEYSLSSDNIEFFVHSPFASRLEDGTLMDRNTDSLVIQITFQVGQQLTKFILASDVPHEALTQIVNITKYHKNEARLEWDIVKLSHHCSYLSLAPEKGKEMTEPVPEAKWFFEEQARSSGIIVSTSKPIPDNDDDNQPPHRQAAAYYRKIANDIGGEFVVTMEHPTVSSPKPLVIIIDENKAKIEKRTPQAVNVITSRPAPRAG